MALHYFIKKRDSLSTVTDFDNFVEKNLDLQFLKSFRIYDTFNATDESLQRVSYWPDIAATENKLRFQIQLSLFRNKILDGNKSQKEVRSIIYSFDSVPCFLHLGVGLVQ